MAKYGLTTWSNLWLLPLLIFLEVVAAGVRIDFVITTSNRKGVVRYAIDSASSKLVDNVIVVDDV